VNLKTLVLSFNEIHKIEGLDSLTNLELLELGFNFIKRIEGLQNLTALKNLELNNNLIYRMEDVNVFRKSNPALTELNLSNNAISEMKSYRILVLHRLETVTTLDGKAISDEERRAAAATSSTITDELLWECSHFVRRSQWSGVARTTQVCLAPSLVACLICLLYVRAPLAHYAVCISMLWVVTAADVLRL